jgi:oleate hydratase
MRSRSASICGFKHRAAQIAVYELFGVDRKLAGVTPHDKSLRVRLDALLKAFK